MTLAAERSAPVQTSFDSLDPGSGEVVGSYPVEGPEAVGAAVARARTAAAWWSGLGFEGRKERLDHWRALVGRRASELAELVHRENGKPLGDAAIEIVTTLDHLQWAAKNAKKVLGVHKVPTGLTAANQVATLEYQPFGVVGVIGPWNYPVFTPMGSIAYALAAGNTVVFKPSEYTPAVGTWLADTLAEAVPEHRLVEVVYGFGDTGAALCRSGVDKLAFTGSARTGRKVMAACAEHLVPVLMECGGKDALLLADDGDVEAAADAAVWGGMSNAGQTCVGIERVYVTDRNYDAFLEAVRRKAGALTAGSGADASYGPITMPGQVDIIQRHVDDALDRGGRAVVGGRDAVHGRYVDPVVLVDVPEDSAAVTEETFGPTLTVSRVKDTDEAVELANDTSYGLGSSVFSRAHGEEIARRLRSGMTAVNSVIAFASVPALPFGGVGESGFGRIHGADGLREFTRAKAITRQRFALPVPITSFRRPAAATAALLRMIRVVHGRG